MNFYCWGTNFRIVGLEKLEKISPTHEEIKLLYKKFKENSYHNIVIISTCNRLEFYWADDNNTRTFIASTLHEFGKDIKSSTNDFYFLTDFDAFCHLVLVTLGFDSMLNIEEEIFSQVKKSYLLAKSLLNLDKTHHIIFQNVIHLSRMVKNKYNFYQFRFSLSDYVVKILTKIFSNLYDKNVLVLGTGLIAKNIINKLYQKIKSVSVYSQSEERINNLMVDINKKLEKVTELKNIDKYDVVISATVADGFVITPEHIFSEHKGITVLFDLGLPRNISPEVGRYKSVFLFTLDDIYNFHKLLFQQKEQEFEMLKTKIIEDIYEVWSRIYINNEDINWGNIKERIKEEIFNNLNNKVEKVEPALVNKLSHNILKSIKEYLIKCCLLLEQEEVN